MGPALVTLVARASVRETGDQARRHLAGALSFGSLLAFLIAVPAALLLPMAIRQERVACCLIVLIGLALNIPVSTANSVWLALQKGHISGFWESMQALLTLAGLLEASHVTQDLRIYVAAVYAPLVLSSLGSLVHLLIAHPHLRPSRADLSVTAVKEIARQGLMYFALAVAGGLSFFFDNVLALELLGPEASARMTIAMRICMTAVGMLVVLSQPLWPAFAEAAERHDGRWIRRRVLRGTAMLVALTAICSFALVAWGEELLRWWLRRNLGIGRGVLIAIAAWSVAQAASRVPNLLLNGLSLIRFQVLVYSLATTLALGMKFLVAKRLGVSGILWSTTITIAAIVTPLSIWQIRRWTEEHGGSLPGVKSSYPAPISAAVSVLSADERPASVTAPSQ